MTKKQRSGSFQTQSEEIIREEALKIARANQVPGQSKEQTKLIAKGIAKGIAEYKKQEKSRQRERDKLQKRRKAPENAAIQVNSEPADEAICSGLDKLAGLSAAGWFLLAGLLHLLRWITGTVITIGTFTVPLYWSVVVGIAALALAVWIFRATRGTPHNDTVAS